MRSIVFAVCVGLGAGCVRVRVKETTFFRPGGIEEAPIPEAIQHRNLELTAADGAILRGRLLQYPLSKRGILFFYGNEGSVLDSAGDMEWLAGRYRADVMSVDYRGYGFSPSRFREGESKLSHLHADSLAAYDSLKSVAGDKAIIAWGYSLGTLFAVHVAAHRRVAGTVLLAPGTSIQDLIDGFMEGLPWYQRMWVTVGVEPTLAAVHPQPIDEIPSVGAPLLVVHGTLDETVPFKLGQKLFDAAFMPPQSSCAASTEAHTSCSSKTRRYASVSTLSLPLAPLLPRGDRGWSCDDRACVGSAPLSLQRPLISQPTTSAGPGFCRPVPPAILSTFSAPPRAEREVACGVDEEAA